MSSGDDFERRHRERMEEAENGIKAFSALEDSKGLQEAANVLRTVVFPTFDECESEDRSRVYRWNKRLISANVPLADGRNVYTDAIGAELELTFSRNRPVTLRIMYSRPEQWLEITFSPSSKASFSIGFSEITRAEVRLKVHELMKLAHAN